MDLPHFMFIAYRAEEPYGTYYADSLIARYTCFNNSACVVIMNCVSGWILMLGGSRVVRGRNKMTQLVSTLKVLFFVIFY
jgi:hypothetical protein